MERLAKNFSQYFRVRLATTRQQRRFAYARSLAARIGSIRRGEGELRYLWQMADEGWSVELSWTRKLGVSLAYLADELELQQQQAMDKGL